MGLESSGGVHGLNRSTKEINGNIEESKQYDTSLHDERRFTNIKVLKRDSKNRITLVELRPIYDDTTFVIHTKASVVKISYSEKHQTQELFQLIDGAPALIESWRYDFSEDGYLNKKCQLYPSNGECVDASMYGKNGITEAITEAAHYQYKDGILISSSYKMENYTKNINYENYIIDKCNNWTERQYDNINKQGHLQRTVEKRQISYYDECER